MVQKRTDIKSLIGRENLTVSEAMMRINENTLGILLIVDSESRLIGTVTDGDIRRWLINNGDIGDPVNELMFTSPRYLKQYKRSEADSIMKEAFIHVLPVVDDEMRIVDIIVDDDNVKVTNNSLSGVNDVPVVIMAGGKGTRLFPYTKILPKPLIPIGDIPIVERIINRFAEQGANDFYFTINYRGGMIKSYFNELSPNYSVHFIQEDNPLGTAGSLRLLEGFNKAFFVSNCDILIDANYGDIYQYHLDSQNVITAVAVRKNVEIPYGVFISEEENVIKSIEEKPQLEYLINSGMYILNPEAINSIPYNEPFNMPELMNVLIKDGCRVGMYIVDEEAFLDMGELEKMQRMEDYILKKNR